MSSAAFDHGSRRFRARVMHRREGGPKLLEFEDIREEQLLQRIGLSRKAGLDSSDPRDVTARGMVAPA